MPGSETRAAVGSSSLIVLILLRLLFRPKATSVGEEAAKPRLQAAVPQVRRAALCQFQPWEIANQRGTRALPCTQSSLGAQNDDELQRVVDVDRLYFSYAINRCTSADSLE